MDADILIMMSSIQSNTYLISILNAESAFSGV